MNVQRRLSPDAQGLGAPLTLLRRTPALLAIGLIRVYQRVISPWTAPSCRYYPSCSAYAVEALRAHGAGRGSWLALRRLGRCHPWTSGGVDHVPPPRAVDPSVLTGA